MNVDNLGYPIYRMNEIHNMLCDLEVAKFADISEKEFEIFELKDGDVLFNRTNSYEWVGRTGIYYLNDNIKRTFASYLVRFVTDKKIILPEYLTTFLNTKQGVSEIKRRARQSINQTNVNPEEVKEIEIPILDMCIQKKIKEYYIEANSLRIEANKLYLKAENLLLEELGLKDWTPKEEAVNIKTINDFKISGRLDAEYYQSKYDEIENKIKNYRGGYDVVRNCFIQNSNASNFNKEMYKYIEIGDINISDSSFEYNVVETKDLPANAKIEIEKNNIIISKVRPYRGAISIINSEEKDIIASGAFTALKESGNFSKETLLILLRTDIYKNWLLKWNVGSSYPVIKDEDILNLIIPKISKQIQTQISSKIQESFRLRGESEGLLHLAKLAVETAIEEGEDKALRLIDDYKATKIASHDN
ncbi:MAG: restriction endonuclease subunit S [Bacteroidia bacterium]|nr:restriction endonuclease subunit S [Bacteroidia bacterium]